MEEEFKKQMIEIFKAGLYKEANGNYSTINKDSTALGKYQFIPKYYWNKSPGSGLKSIKSFAKEKGFGDLNGFEDYLNNPNLQEAYFNEYASKRVYPEVKNAFLKNPDVDLRFDELMALYHFEPASMKKYLKDGSYRVKTDINPSGKEDLSRYNNSLKKFNIPTIDNSVVKSKLAEDNLDLQIKINNEYETYKERKNKILSNGLDTNIQNSMIDNLNKEYYEKGYISKNNEGAFNKLIQDENIQAENDYNIKKETNKSFVEFLNKNLIPTQKRIKSKAMNPALFDINTDGKKEPVEVQNIKKFKIKITKDNIEELKRVVSLDEMSDENVFSKKDIKIGKEIYINNSKDNKILKRYQDGINFFRNDNNPVNIFQDGKLSSEYFTTEKKRTLLGFKAGHELKTDGGIVDFEKFGIDLSKPFNKSKLGHNITINPNWDYQIENERKALESKKNNHNSSNNSKSANSSNVKNQGSNQGLRPPAQTIKEDKFDEENFNALFKKGITPKKEWYNPDNYKNDVPYDDVAKATALFFQGKSLADTKIPLHTEEVSEAYKNYAAEMAKISKIGLDPTEESYAKRMLTEAYSSGVKNLVRASNGNRNLVLGNLGRLDFQKQQGLLKISLEDAKAKRDAMQKYGEAMKYINEFDSKRDIKNKIIEQNQALKDKEAGSALMGAGMQGLLNSLNDYKSNKPGTFKHAYESKMKIKLFGFDNNIKDGEEGSRSWAEKKYEENLTNFIKTSKISDQALSLKTEDKEKVMSLIDKTGNFEDANNIIPLLANNKVGGELSFEKLNEARKNNDYSILFSRKKEDNVENNLIANYDKKENDFNNLLDLTSKSSIFDNQKTKNDDTQNLEQAVSSYDELYNN